MAKKIEKKSLASLIGQREINPKEVEKAATAIHKPKAPEKEKKIRVSVDTPKSLYLKSKGAALEEGIPHLKDFYLHCVKEYLNSKGKL